ncbi:hypothetical protein INT47_001359 [Mucor saturninus]|uniref:Uncharacterized protein n=1 Tax=Mucor saturninus TaxID=64648 RepID=A0A8H7V2E1_9FUNG|nr:hypothetical protein INT47_001359 [Mucor saturninus]
MSMNIQPYCPINVNVTVPIETYKTVIQESVSKHSVKWNFNKHQNTPTGYLNGRQRQPTYIFREYYVCHRPGSKSEHAGVVRGGTSVQVVHQWLLQARSVCFDATHSNISFFQRNPVYDCHKPFLKRH